MTDPKETSLPQPEDFWLEIGPPCSYLGLDAWDAALREGDASPDGKRRGFSGAEPGQAPADTAVMAAAVVSFAACEKESGNKTNPDGIDGTVMTAEGIWEAGSTIEVDRHILVPEGKSLTIEEGVTVIFSDKGVGINRVPIEFTVDGNLYCLGTEESPVMLTVAESSRTEENKFKGLWGGIVAGAK